MLALSQNRNHFVLLIYALFPLLVSTVSPSVYFNEKYINTVSIQIDTSSFGNTTAAPWNSLTYNITYPLTMESQPQKSLVLSMEAIHIIPMDSTIQFEGSLGTIQNSFFTLLLNSNMPSYIKLLHYRVLILTSSYSAWNNSNIIIVETPIALNKNISSSTYHLEIVSLAYPLNSTGTLISFVSLVGLHLKSTSNNLLDLGIEVGLNQTHLNYSVVSRSLTPTFAYSLRISTLICNKYYYQRQQFAEVDIFDYEGNLSINSYYYKYSSIIYEQNMMVGFSKIKVTQDFLNLNVNFYSSSRIYITTTNSPNFVKLTVFELKTYYCPYSTPYYFYNSCYSTCPSGSVPNKSTLTCKYCSNGQFYYNLTCVTICPIAYYPNITTMTCEPCQTFCSICSSSTACLTCQQGYYLFQKSCYIDCPSRTVSNSISRLCLNCPYDCFSCSLDGLCLTCTIADFRSLKEGRCVPIEGFFDSGQSVCSKCPVGCSTCTSSTLCSDQSSSTIPIFILLSSVLGGIILIVIVIIVCKKMKSNPNPPQEDHGEISEQRLRVTWNREGVHASEECIICLCDHPTFLSACGHFYHMECIVAWRHNSCPLCRRPLYDESHKIICKGCMSSSQVISFKEMKIMLKNGRSVEVVCDECKMNKAVL